MQTCSACGTRNPPVARFCMACGTPLHAGTVRPGEERRIVTVLFCDLVGFTARADRADPEDVKATLRPYHARLQREIERYDGHVNQFLGDGVLAVFGAPRAHEDDPERAVRAALRIQEAMDELNERDPAHPLAARIGIETGEAVVAAGTPTQAGGTVTGDITNTAARLQTVAPPGGIVVGEHTYRATEREFRYEALDPVEVKGKAERLAIWQPVGSRSRLPGDIRVRFSTPLIGRDDELAVLEGLLLRIIRTGAPGFAVVTGEAGVGKSRLVAELAEAADRLPDLVRWRQGRPIPFGDGESFAPLADVVKAEAGILESDTAEAAMTKLDHAVAEVTPEAERALQVERLLPLAGLAVPTVDSGGGWGASAADRADVFGAWRRFLERLAGSNPFVLVFDDLHAAVDPMLAFIEHLVETTVEVPLLVVAAGRPDLLTRRPRWRDLGTHVDVAPLDRRSTSRLIRVLLEDADVPGATVDALVERSEGIPLFAEELTRLVRERGADGATMPVPHSLRSLIAARLDGLEPDERAVLQDAAVVGRSFWTGAVAAIAGLDAGRLDAGRLDALLDDLVTRELLRRIVPSTVRGEDEYAFWHAIVRDVAYGQIPRSARAGKHRSVARWLETLAGNRVDDRVELLAYHFDRAHRLASEAGDDAEADEILEPTVRYLRLAAERSSGFDPERAMRLAERALKLLPTDHSERPRLLTQAGRVAETLGRYDRAEAYQIEALHAFQDRDDQIGRADVMIALARTRMERGDMEDVGTLTAVALGLLEAEPRGPELALAYARHAGLLLVEGDYEGCLRRATQGLAIARELGLVREEVLALNYAGTARGLLGDEGGLADLREAIERGTRGGAGNETAIAMNNLATDLRYLRSPREALEVWKEMEGFCAEHGLVTAGSWAKAGLAESLFDLGRWDEVLSLTDELLRWEDEYGPSMTSTTAVILAGWVEVRRGHVDDAGAWVDAALERAAKTGVAEYEAPAHALAAEVALMRGDDGLARRHLEGFEDVAANDRLFAAAVLPVVARLFIRLGDPRRARALLEDLPPLRSRRERLSAETVAAVLVEAEGHPDAALTQLRGLRDAWRAYGFPLETGLTGTALARCLHALGRHDEAARVAADAAEVLSDLGADPLARAASALAEPGRHDPQW